MGYRGFLMVVRGKEPAVVQRELNVTATEEFEADPPASPICATVLSDGAYLLEFKLGHEPCSALLSQLSKSASLLTCSVNETVMVSCASSWLNGREQWFVMHDADQGLTQLETGSELPGQFQAIREELLEKQRLINDCDYMFDVPVELFAAMGGMRYDTDLEVGRSDPWQVLTPVHSSAFSWFRRWWPVR